MMKIYGITEYEVREAFARRVREDRDCEYTLNRVYKEDGNYVLEYTRRRVRW